MKEKSRKTEENLDTIDWVAPLNEVIDGSLFQTMRRREHKQTQHAHSRDGRTSIVAAGQRRRQTQHPADH